MDKDDVVVEDEDIHDEHSKLNQERHEESNEARRLSLFIVVVHLEQISVQVLIGHVDDTNEEEVQASGNTVPSDELADADWEATDVLLRQVADYDQEREEKGVRQGAHDDSSQLLVHSPVSVIHLDFVPFPRNADNGSI